MIIFTALDGMVFERGHLGSLFFLIKKTLSRDSKRYSTLVYNTINSKNSFWHFLAHLRCLFWFSYSVSDPATLPIEAGDVSSMTPGYDLVGRRTLSGIDVLDIKR